MHLKMLQKEKFDKQQKQQVIWLATKLLKNLQKIKHKINIWETVKSETEKPKERHISQVEKQEIIDELRLMQ